MPAHILTSYDATLASLEANASKLHQMAAANLQTARTGVRGRDEASCTRAIADDEGVNQLERQIDAQGLDILTRYQPVARDLRLVIAIMRVASNLERISDEAKNIARRGRNILGSNLATDELDPLFDLAIEELEDATKSFFTRDRELAASLRPKDKTLDALHRGLIETWTERIAGEHQSAPAFLNLLFITRSLERIGDHAKNIAEETAFVCGPQ